MMKSLYYELALNSQYLYDFEIIIESYEILKNEKFTNELIQHIKNTNEDNLELKIQHYFFQIFYHFLGFWLCKPHNIFITTEPSHLSLGISTRVAFD